MQDQKKNPLYNVANNLLSRVTSLGVPTTAVKALIETNAQYSDLENITDGTLIALRFDLCDLITDHVALCDLRTAQASR